MLLWGFEICKQAGTPAVTGPFSFSVNGGAPISVGTGLCTAPMQVPAGQATIAEAGTTYSSVSAIASAPAGTLVSSSLTGGTATVSVPASASVSAGTTVTFTNTLVTGVLEICKNAVTGSGLTGNATFTVAGPMGFASSQTVPVGACSTPITMPAGNATISEANGASTFLSSISTLPSGRLVSSNLAGGSAVVGVPSGDTSNETIATFTNGVNAATLKLCKVAGASSLIGTNASFTVTGAASSPITIPAGAGPGGNCVLVSGSTPWVSGNRVTVTEAAGVGSQVSAITVNPSSGLVGTPDLAGQSVTATLGSGENVITFTNMPAVAGTLKICKAVTGTPAAGSIATFAVSGYSGTVSVPAGACEVVGGSTTPFAFPFNSTPTITETGFAPGFTGGGFVVTSVVASPTARLLGTPDLAGKSGQVTIGSGVTEVTFTNAAAPATTAVPAATGAGATGGSTTGGNTSGTATAAASSAAASTSSGGGSTASAGASASSGGSTSTSPGAGTPSGGGSTSSSSAAGVAATSKTTMRTSGVLGARKSSRARVTSLRGRKTAKIVRIRGAVKIARFVMFKHHRYLAVRMKGSVRIFRIRIVLLGRGDKVVRALTRTVKTNKLVRIAAIGSAVHGFRVTPVA